MSTNVSRQPDHIVALQDSLNYQFSSLRYLVEALRAPGSGANMFHDYQGTDGYRRLAQLGEIVIRLAIVDDGYSCGSERGEAPHHAKASNCERVQVPILL